MARFTYKDIDIRLERKNNGDIQELTEVDAVKESINNIVQTIKGQRRKIPEFSSTLWEQLFEPMDEVTAQSIGEETLNIIEKWEPRVVIDNIHISPNYRMNRYDVSANFRLRNSEQTEEIDIILERG